VLRKELLDRAWQRLDDAQRMLLALHDIEGYSLAELTEITGLKEGTLKSRLHRSRVQLGKLLKYENRVGARLTGVGGSR
jgi:RNA polymerase sigma-70 factor (ECF subfamily)